MNYSQHSFGDNLSYLSSFSGMHVNGMRQENINAGWIENSSPYNCFSGAYYGECHPYEHYPYSTTNHYMGDDFNMHQTCFDHSFYPGGILEQQESLDPYVRYCPNPPFYSYPYIEEQTLEYKEKSDLQRLCEEFAESTERFSRKQNELATSVESSVQNIGIYASQIIASLETMRQDNSLSMISTPCVDDDYCEEIEDVELNETLPLVACDKELEITFGENNGCPIEVPPVESNLCEFDVETNVDIANDVVHVSPVEVLTLTDESQVDFMGCSKILEIPKSVCKYMHVVLSLNSVNNCTLKLSMIEEVQLITLNDHCWFLKYCCLKRNEDKVILVFDTFD